MRACSTLFTALPLALMAAGAWAAMPESAVNDAVGQALARGDSPESVIQMLVEDGRSLVAAGRAAVSAASGDPQLALARAAICAAGDLTEAEQVAQAAASESAQRADEIRAILRDYGPYGCSQPDRYRRPPSIYTPTDAGEGLGSPGSPSS